MIEKKIVAIFRLEGDTEYTMFDDMSYRCDHWAEGMWSYFCVRHGVLSVCHTVTGGHAPHDNNWDVWLACPDDEMLGYQLLRERFELELEILKMLG